ncbi:MAG: electron transfer flavoprotein subunit beta/FixA family protein [candidate division WOR-3 bacterium]
MRIVVCVKQVPSTETKIRINSQTRFVDTSEVEWVINPYDEYAIETALRIREKLGTGQVSCISLGPERVKLALRTCLSMGADAAFQVWEEGLSGIDPLSVGRVLAAAIAKSGFDLVLCGKQAIDDDFGAVPQAIAHFLGIPHVAVVPEVTVQPGFKSLVAHREVEGAAEVVNVDIPCLLTIQKGSYQPRYPTLKLMMAAKAKPIPCLGLADLGLDAATLTRRIEFLEDRLPPGRKPGRVLEGELEQVVPELVRLLHEEAKVV